MSVFKLEGFLSLFLIEQKVPPRKKKACDSTSSQQVAILGSTGFSLSHCLADRLACSENKPKADPDTKTMQNLIICD